MMAELWEIRMDVEIVIAHRMDAPDYMPAGSIKKDHFDLQYWYASPTMLPREEDQYEE